MSEVKITAAINLDQDHCKYGQDLNHFLDKVKALKKIGAAPEASGAARDAYFKAVSALKVHYALRNLALEIKATDGKSQYMITVDGVDRSPVIDNQIWMHELPQVLVELLQA